MRILYHIALSPFCRKVRVALAEKKLDADLMVEPVWERRAEFLQINPAGEVPVLTDEENIISGSDVIIEYLEETSDETPLLPGDPAARAEVRRIAKWFDAKFNREVTELLVGEKLMKRFLGLGEPSSEAIRAGHANIGTHLDYIGYLAERRTWLAGDHFSVADIAAAAHLSAVDYLGDVDWDRNAETKEWYARVKSRPSFRSILSDHIPGVAPPRHYADLDF